MKNRADRLLVPGHAQILAADDPRLDSILVLIEPAKALKHSGATLWSHLIGTYELLSAWGAPSEVCYAGALHSIYSTQYFSAAVASQATRGEIAHAVGKRVEQLVHAFCTLDRDSVRAAASNLASQPSIVRLTRHASRRCVRVATSTVRHLRLMDIANEIEQRQRLSAEPAPFLANLARAYREIGFSPVALPRDAVTTSSAAEGELLRSYAKALAAIDRHASALFARCVAAVPCCAEPRLMLSEAYLTAGQSSAAYAHSSQALAHMRGWAAAWDNRVPFLAWEVLALQLMDAARRGSRRAPPIANQIKARLRST